MRMIKTANEAEMIALFLLTEWESSRFGSALREVIHEMDQPSELVTRPDLASGADNAARRDVLARFRGFGRDEDLFAGFPQSDEVQWEWAELDPGEVLAIRYIRYSYWDEISGGTRLPPAAAQFVRRGDKVFGHMTTAHFLDAADQVKVSWPDWPPIIAVRATPADRPVVLEGHARLTIMAIAAEAIPDVSSVLIGTSPAMPTWSGY
ncbi:hypothetical protein [Microlunatus speluncae]|uniref:hypothetical protein n=1 Tax=Microlunatus speluncae TaxID=2594267 RepID=UPI0012660B80|nr:hypothetical protein [Microlunatus speluncae]